MFAQQESSLLIIFRGMPKQVPAYTALLFSGQIFLWRCFLPGTAEQGYSKHWTNCQFSGLLSQMQLVLRGSCFYDSCVLCTTAHQWENCSACRNGVSRFLLLTGSAVLTELGALSAGCGLTKFLVIMLLIRILPSKKKKKKDLHESLLSAE